MQIEVKGRNTPITDELREYVEKRFRKVAKQVSELARLEIELKEEKNPAIADNMVAEATLYLKGVTLRAKDDARDLRHAINLCEEELVPPGQAPPREAPRAPQGRDRREHPDDDGTRARRRHAGRILTASREAPAAPDKAAEAPKPAATLAWHGPS